MKKEDIREHIEFFVKELEDPQKFTIEYEMEMDDSYRVDITIPEGTYPDYSHPTRYRLEVNSDNSMSLSRSNWEELE